MPVCWPLPFISGFYLEMMKMVNKNYKVITLCGSTRFKELFEYYNKKFTLQGHCVFTVVFYGRMKDESKPLDFILLDEETKELLDEVHKRKIYHSDKIFVINKWGYVGKSTAKEIEYAIELGKEVEYMVDPKESSFWKSFGSVFHHGR